MIKKREKKQIKKRNREKGKRRKKEGDKFARPKNFLFRPNCVFDTLARAERRSTNRAAKRTDEEMYTQKGRKFRAVSLRLDALDGKQCRESWRENFFFLSFFFFFFFFRIRLLSRRCTSGTIFDHLADCTQRYTVARSTRVGCTESD